jgi:hypothetical protein
MKIEVGLEVSGLTELRNSIQSVTNNLSKQLGIISWKTSNDGKSFIAKSVEGELRVPQKVIKKTIIAKRMGNNRDVLLIVLKTARIALKEFKPKQDNQGVTAKINKSGSPYQVKSGFMGPKPGKKAPRLGGHAYRRIGGDRLPLRKLKGPSPWGVFVRDELDLKLRTYRHLKDRLRYHMERQLRYLTLKKQGVI